MDCGARLEARGTVDRQRPTDGASRQVLQDRAQARRLQPQLATTCENETDINAESQCCERNRHDQHPDSTTALFRSPLFTRLRRSRATGHGSDFTAHQAIKQALDWRTDGLPIPGGQIDTRGS